ncbi:Haloacid dehalogenase-like hydrolase (HAD) superfamily protein [Striga hermonthica]|uniref:Haloacid dehalogenase-like hydrolase (HAD) superfamily protein n=1 Tax=Striga hermonthica TaxID=68872 RepID=A0A9N7R8R0_STRHE|nr:Haloacid dehalogenase-like hydrolase (HAD) superfamily protein [Striga hermonthica]
MISRRFRSPIRDCITDFRRFGTSFMAAAAAAASNFMVGHKDFHMASLRALSSTSASSAIDTSTSRFFKNRFTLKACSSQNYGSALRNNNDNNNNSMGSGVQKARVYSPCVRQLLGVSEEAVKVVEDQQKSLNSRAVNGSSAANRGNFKGALGQPFQDKVMVAVDVDEVLGNFVSALNQFIADRYSLNHSVSEYHVYEFFKLKFNWLSSVSADIRVHEFFKTHYFRKGIRPIPGAREALQKLSEIYNLSIVTSRQNAIKEHTIEWIDKHYPGLFQEIHFGNHFALEGQSKPKSEICKSLGAKVLIDDNPRYAIECAEVGIKVLLFDYENSYPWCKFDAVPRHPLVTKVHNWEEVEHQLASWVVS